MTDASFAFQRVFSRRLLELQWSPAARAVRVALETRRLPPPWGPWGKPRVFRTRRSEPVGNLLGMPTKRIRVAARSAGQNHDASPCIFHPPTGGAGHDAALVSVLEPAPPEDGSQAAPSPASPGPNLCPQRCLPRIQWQPPIPAKLTLDSGWNFPRP